MATIRQKKLAKAIVENATADKPLNKQELVVSSGYSPTTADGHANQIIEQKGVQDELKEVYGFDPETAKNVVADILISSEDHNRLKAADMIFKVHGSYAPEKRINANVDVPAPLSAEDRELLEILKQNDRNTGTETV